MTSITNAFVIILDFLPMLFLLTSLAIPLTGYGSADDMATNRLSARRGWWRVSTEQVHWPKHESIDLASGNVLFELEHNLLAGAGVYGAVGGKRGGFIALGASVEFSQPLARSWSCRAGIFVGAGGGHGSNALAGGGLMIRENVGLNYETAHYGNFGLGVSHVQFPSGVIGSSQTYLQYELPFYTVYNRGWSNPSIQAADTLEANNAPFRTSEVVAVLHNYVLPASAVVARGDERTMQLLGIEWVARAGERWFTKLESAGAIGGQNKGYMQIFAGGGYQFPLSRGAALKVFASAGPAGGGGIDTGGGLMVDAGVALQKAISMHVAMEVSVSRIRAPSSGFAARSVAAKLAYRFDTPEVSGDSISLTALRAFKPIKLRLRLANQTYIKADDNWRNSQADRSVSNMGVQLDYFYLPSWFVTGQGLAAYAGDAGGYMTGQLGIGRRWTIAERWFAEGEGLLGAAGGGGLEVGGGMVGQVNVSLGYHLTNAFSVIGTFGRVQSRQGAFKASVVGVSLAYQFTAFAR
jgi:hypothetical protein